MALRSVFTDLFALQHPIALAPMGGASGGALAAAVANGGGLGLVGGGRAERSWLDRELEIAADRSSGPWGVGFQSWATDLATVERALARHPHAVMLSFGDPRPFLPAIRQEGAALIVQVTDLEEARQAVDVGADVIVAQGTEAGGHGGSWSTLPFVPIVTDLVSPTPVLAAGGIADGRGVAAALMLGAAGVLLGTRFLATLEALVPAVVTTAILESGGEETVRSRVFDIAGGAGWPSKYTARTLRNSFLDRWRGRERDLAANAGAQAAYQQALAQGDVSLSPAWASQAIDLIRELSPAADLVGALAAQAEEQILRVQKGPG